MLVMARAGGKAAILAGSIPETSYVFVPSFFGGCSKNDMPLTPCPARPWWISARNDASLNSARWSGSERLRRPFFGPDFFLILSLVHFSPRVRHPVQSVESSVVKHRMRLMAHRSQGRPYLPLFLDSRCEFESMEEERQKLF